MISVNPQRLLAYIRSIAEGLMTERCDIEARAPGTDEYGAAQPRWLPVATDVPCRVITGYEFSRPRTETVGEQTTIIDTMRLCVPVGTNLATDMRVKINNQWWLVVSLLTERTSEIDEQAVITRTT